MLSKCANPACATPFHYYRDGKLFRVEVGGTADADGKRGPKRLEHYWLCGVCALTHTLAVQKDKSILTVALPPSEGKSKSAVA